MSPRWWVAAAAVALLPLAASPAEAGGPAPGWRQVDVGDAVSCGIRTTGRAYCWGNDAEGVIGNGPPRVDQPQPAQVAGGHTDWVSISVGDRHACGLRTGGRLFCWGADVAGELGNGPPQTSSSSPVAVSGGQGQWTSVSAGFRHSCARRVTGTLWCWGADTNGRLGNGAPTGRRTSPVVVAGGITNWASVSAGGSHTCARRTSGRLYCWGADFFGQLGDSVGLGEQDHPVQVAGGRTDWASVSAGLRHVCARRTTGRLFCWGGNSGGQLGLGTAGVNQPRPVEVFGGQTDWVSVSAGGLHTCGRRASGRAWCWGNDSSGELGDDPDLDQKEVPVLVAGFHADWVSVSTGRFTTCGRRAGGLLFCWGSDVRGQVGDGPPNANQPQPVAVS